jgi:carbonic anhydrase
MTPQEALKRLQSGNLRFVQNRQETRDLTRQVRETSTGQSPFAIVLGCIDSRVPPELVFDQGIGDIFTVRIAGNFVNDDILGSMEFATKVVGAKLILVLGHTRCGAIQGAYNEVELGNLTALLAKLKSAVEVVVGAKLSEAEIDLDEIAALNVRLTIEEIKQQSPILRELSEAGEIAIEGAMYDVFNGQVSFL